MWTTVIARVVYISVRYPQSILSIRQNEYRLHGFVWGISLGLTLLPLTTQDYGVAGGWCWIGNDNPSGSDDAWRYLTFYAPLWLAMAFNVIAYCFVRSTLKEMAVISGVAYSKQRVPPALMYPLVLVAANVFATVNRIQNSIAPDQPIFFLYVMHELFNNLAGLGNAVVFFCTPRVYSVVRDHFTGSTSPSLEESVGRGEADMKESEILSSNETLLGTSTTDSSGVRLRRNSIDELEDVSYVTRSTYAKTLGLYDLMGLDLKRDQFRQLEQLQISRGVQSRAVERDSARSSQENIGAKQDATTVEAGQLKPTNADLSMQIDQSAAVDKTSVSQTYFTFFKSFIGIGILALPHGFYLAGYIGGPAGMIFVAGVSYYCMLMLLDCRELVVAQVRAGTVNSNFLPAEIRNSASAKSDLADIARDGNLVITYSDIGRAAMGSTGAKLVDFAIVSSQMGFSTAYIIFIGSNVQSALASCSGSALWSIVASALVCPLVWLRSLRKLAMGAIFADVAILFGLIVILGFAFNKMGSMDGTENSALPSTTPSSSHLEDTSAAPFGNSPFLFFGMAVFAFEGAGIILPMQQAMREPEKFKPILRNGMVVITALYAVFPLVTYLAWGSDIEDMVTANLPQRAPIVITVELLYCTGLFLTFPIMMWPAVQILEGSRMYRSLDCFSSKSENGNSLLQSILFRTLLVAIVSTAAIFIPKFGLFVSLIGCFSCSMLAFILPALFSLKLDESGDGRSVRWFMVAFGVIGGGISFVITMIELVEAIANDAEGSSMPAGCNATAYT